MSTRYFRAGVGTVIYNTKGEIAIFKRAQPPVGVWQFQQGGIDLGEDPQQTLWRELKEEVGLENEDIDTVIPIPGWHSYQDLGSYEDTTIPRIGQIHRWFFIKLKSEISIDLSKATDKEFGEWKFTSFEEAILATSDHKKHIYEMLKTHFEKHIFSKD
jgi:putative (di)nucleoside polyphosphate hydrolase